jgi:hypothetical protein
LFVCQKNTKEKAVELTVFVTARQQNNLKRVSHADKNEIYFIFATHNNGSCRRTIPSILFAAFSLFILPKFHFYLFSSPPQTQNVIMIVFVGVFNWFAKYSKQDLARQRGARNKADVASPNKK